MVEYPDIIYKITKEKTTNYQEDIDETTATITEKLIYESKIKKPRSIK